CAVAEVQGYNSVPPRRLSAESVALRVKLKILLFMFFCIRHSLLAHSHLAACSARLTTSGGITTPIWLAVLRLSARSNFVGCTRVKSPGLAPLKIWSMYSAARRERSGKFTP